jgi:hypothetical protein
MNKKFNKNVKNLNLLDSDIFGAYSELREASKIQLDGRKVTRVLDKGGNHKYYTIEQKKDGTPFVFELDNELYKESERIMHEILENLSILQQVEGTQLKYRDKKEKVEKSFTQFVGGSGMLPINTEEKIEFLKNTVNKITLTKTFLRGSKTADIKNFPVNFIIQNDKISIKENTQTINEEKYKTKLKEKDGTLTLRFDDIE